MTKSTYCHFKAGYFASSMVHIPWFLKHFTVGVEYHCIHHLNHKVPGYKLEECYNSRKDLFVGCPHLTWTSIFHSLRYTVYDEDLGKHTSVYKVYREFISQ